MSGFFFFLNYLSYHFPLAVCFNEREERSRWFETCKVSSGGKRVILSNSADARSLDSADVTLVQARSRTSSRWVSSSKKAGCGERGLTRIHADCHAGF